VLKTLVLMLDATSYKRLVFLFSRCFARGRKQGSV